MSRGQDSRGTGFQPVQSQRHGLEARATGKAKWSVAAIVIVLIGGTSLVTTRAQAPAAASPFEVFPREVILENGRDFQSLVVRMTDAQGVSRDVTHEVQFGLSDPKIAKVEGAVVKPGADGSATIYVKHASGSASVPVTVKNAAVQPPISFKLDVMPVFMKAGCNTGGCHGAARGKDGFNLSLFGYDPDGDYHRLTREQALRRINLALPAESLLLTKTTGAAQHTGGTRFKEDSAYYKAIHEWLSAGAPQDPPTVATPVGVELYPQQMVLEEATTQRLTVRAKYSDGTDRDVTSLAVFLSNNDQSAAVSEQGVITAGKRGEAFVMARFATFTVGSQAIVIPKNLEYSFPSVPENNYIDALVNAKLRKLRIRPSELSSDEVFIRRVFLDVVGQLPTPEEFEKFIKDTDAKKREKLVDELLGRKEFVEMWVMKWAELLQIRSNNDRMSYKATVQYYNWLQDKIADNTPFDQIVQQLLSAKGGTFENPATNYYQVETDTLKIAENTAQIFMGMRIQCAQCHNHPFDRWTMNDYYGFASFFSQVGRKRGEDPRETIVVNSGGGEANHLLTKKPVPPTFLGGGAAKIEGGQDRREVVAKWLASAENPYFARNLSNIVWAHFFGRGIIDPVDDVRISNPSVNPELLDALAKNFTDYKYDFKRLVRDICTSRTYQLSTKTNETNESDGTNFSHGPIRRIRAEVLLDVISQVTDTKEKFRGLPLGARAVQIADGQTNSYFLRTFGRATRETVCSCEVKMEPNLSQALHLLNGTTVNQKIQAGGVVRKMIEAKKPPEQILEDLYVRAMTRKPTAKEKEKLLAMVNESPEKERGKAMEDLFWAVLNSQEFIFNH